MKKRIIYCWFGGNEMDEVSAACLNSWRREMPDYEIMRIDETAFDPNIFANTGKLHARGQYAFVSDIARVWALANYGGIYLDTDVYALKSLDDFLGMNAFFGVLSNGNPNLGVIGGKEYWTEILDDYASMGENFIPLGILLKRKLKLTENIKVMQEINGCTLIPNCEFFAREKECKMIPKTAYNVHLFNGSEFANSTASRNEAKKFLLNIVEK